jgi:hypothetical protein
MYLRDPADNLVEIDWPDARSLDARIRKNLIALNAVAPQSVEALSATLYLDRRDGRVDEVALGVLRKRVIPTRQGASR